MAASARVLQQKRLRGPVAVVGLLILACPVSAGAAETRPVAEAVVLGPSRCLHTDALARHVTRWLGRDVIDDRLTIEVHDMTEGVRFVVRRDGWAVGERTLDVRDASCEELDAAVGLAIASAVDVALRAEVPPAPDAEASSPADPRGPAAEPTPTDAPTDGPTEAPPVAATRAVLPSDAAPPPADDTAPQEPPSEPAPDRAVVLGAEAVMLANVLPDVTLAAAIAGSFAVAAHVELRLSALISPSTTVDLRRGGDGEVDGAADVALYAGRADVCGGGDVLEGRVWIRGCGGIVAGAVPAEGRGVEAATSTVAPWVAAAGRAEAQWIQPRSRLGLLLAVDGFAVLSRPGLEARDAGEVRSSREFPMIGVGIALGPCFRF